MSEQKWTPHQADAIHHGGHDILVSASAGSGKTAVLVERIIQQVLSGADITRMLIVTFTNAATDEMREKIQRGLKARLSRRTSGSGEALTPTERRNLARAIVQSPTANISTLDAFAKQVVSEYYYLLSLDPQFRIETDETEIALLNQRVFDALKEDEFYPGSSTVDPQAFLTLTENFDQDLSDAGLAQIVFTLVEFAQSLPDAKQWLNHLATDYQSLDAFMHRYWLQLHAELTENAAQWRELIAATEAEPELAKVTQVLQTSLRGVEAVLALEEPSYSELRGRFSQIEFPRWPSNKVDPELAALRKTLSPQRKALQDTLKSLSGPLDMPQELLESVMAETGQALETLSAVTLRFMDALAAEKQARQVQGFGDIMQHALTILRTLDPATGRPVADNYRAAFDTILVDEYQDLNSLQEEILRLIATSQPGNRFMVGDVKQSIYGFRLANPQLFLTKYERFQRADSEDELVILGENFRSSRNVLNFTNLIFTQLMDRTVGKLSYDENAELLLGPGIPDAVNPASELLLLTTDRDEEASSETDDEAERDASSQLARVMIERIQELVNDQEPSFFDKEKGTFRHLEYGDITILVRSSSDNVTLQSEFAKAGVPIIIPKAKNYFQTTELMTMLSVLRLIDNPTQDVALVAVLRSPIVGLSADELAQIRLQLPRGAFYRAVETLLDGEDDALQPLREKVQAFMSQLAQWRHDARNHELVDLIWRIYRDTAYFDFVGGQPGGDQRQANLRALSDRAAAFEQNGFRGLFSFVRFIEQMQKSDKDLDTPVFIDPGLNAVKLMTTHASKGLQFPVVFLWRVQKRFRLGELSDTLILNRDSIGMKWIDHDREERFQLPQWYFAQSEKKAQLYAEEMRLLYVALTRAQQKLVLVGAVKNEESALSKWQQATTVSQRVLPAGMRLKDASYLDWIGHALARAGVFEEMVGRTDLQRFKTPITVQFTAGGAPTQDPLAPEAPPTEENLGIDFKRYWALAYPQEAATHLSSFQSVSELKNIPALNDPAINEVVVTNHGPLNQRQTADFAVPKFAQTLETSAAAIGTATHLLLKEVALDGAIDTALTATRDELIASGALNERVGAQVNLSHLRRFFASELGQLLLQYPDRVQREVPFSLLLPAGLVYGTPEAFPDDYDVLVHGVIDGYVETPEGIVLFDYKTDHAPTASKLLARYRVQVQTYAQALSLMRHQPVTRSVLVALETGELVPV